MEDFKTLMDRVRAGSGEAAGELVETYGGLFRRAVRRVLNRSRRLRSLFDTVDFTQLAWDVFLREPARWGEIESAGQLCGCC